MSHELNVAITIPDQPLILAAPVLVVVLVLAIVVLRKRRRPDKTMTAWAEASAELGIDFAAKSPSGGPRATGKVNSHVVSVSPERLKKGRKKQTVTRYTIKYEAPEAPVFTLVKRTNNTIPVVDTGNPKFDAVVAIRTEQPAQLARFMTPARRAAVLRLLTYWPAAQLTNREANLRTVGIEKDHDKVVDSICHLVATAETFDRPTPATPQATPEDSTESAAGSVVDNGAAVTSPAADRGLDEDRAAGAPAATSAHSNATSEPASVDDASMDELVAAAHAVYARGLESGPSDSEVPNDSSTSGEADLLTEVRLDEATVLNDLFNSGLDTAGTAARFQQVYAGRQISWSGEVLRVGSLDGDRQRIAVFVGSADGQNPESGRVVALTAVPPEAGLAEGAVVAFSGSLVNLDASQRLFHIA